MAETFGEADVVLRVRLDELQKQLDASERLVMASTDRVAQAQAQAVQEVSRANEAASSGGFSALRAASDAHTAWSLLKLTVGAVRMGLMAIPAVATAARLSLLGVATGGIAALTLGVGALVDGTRRVGDSVHEAVEAFRGLDGSKEKAMAVADALGRIAVVGGAARQVFLMMNRDTGLQDEAWTSLVATIEDGQVKLRWYARALNALAHLDSGIIANALGIPPEAERENFGRDIDRINAKMRQLRALMGVQAAGRGHEGMVGDRAGGIAQSAERAAELAGLEGVERVRVEERHRFEDAMQLLETLQNETNDFYSQQRAQIEATAKAEGASYAEMQARLAESQRSAERAGGVIQRARVMAAQMLGVVADENIGKARQEQAEQEKLTRLQERRAQAALQSQREGLIADAAAAKLRASGEEFAAQEVELEAARQRALRNLMVEGNDELVALTQQKYDRLGALIEAREKEQLARQKELEEKKAEAVLDANARLRSQILQRRLEQAGREIEAQEEAIRQRFQEQIEQMERDGNRVGANLAAKLRDLEIASLEQDRAVGRRAEFEQVAFSRTNFAGFGLDGNDKIDREQLAVLKSIDRKTTKGSRPAVAG